MKKVVKTYYLLNDKDIKSIKKQLIDLDLTYERLARKTGIGKSYISLILTGRKHLTEKVKNKFGQAGIFLGDK